MALVLKTVYNYRYLIESAEDPQAKNDLLSSTLLLIIFTVSYVFFVKKLGPKLMEHRKPYDIKTIIIIYNALQIIINVKITIEAYFAYFGSSYWICLKSSEMDLILFVKKEFLILKMIDCIETVFFILRKSFRQVSFLHVYHHCGMVVAVWVSHKYVVGHTEIFIGLINSFVHSIMFVYYLLTSIDPKWKNNLTIKRGLTQLQLIQFIFFIVVLSANLIIPDCNGDNFGCTFYYTKYFYVYFILRFLCKIILEKGEKHKGVIDKKIHYK